MPRAVWQGKALVAGDKVAMVRSACCPQSPAFQGPRHHEICPWKGTARNDTVVVDGQKNPHAAWYYDAPRPRAA